MKEKYKWLETNEGLHLHDFRNRTRQMDIIIMFLYVPQSSYQIHARLAIIITWSWINPKICGKS